MLEKKEEKKMCQHNLHISESFFFSFFSKCTVRIFFVVGYIVCKAHSWQNITTDVSGKAIVFYE